MHHRNETDLLHIFHRIACLPEEAVQQQILQEIDISKCLPVLLYSFVRATKQQVDRIARLLERANQRDEICLHIAVTDAFSAFNDENAGNPYRSTYRVDSYDLYAQPYLDFCERDGGHRSKYERQLLDILDSVSRFLPWLQIHITLTGEENVMDGRFTDFNRTLYSCIQKRCLRSNIKSMTILNQTLLFTTSGAYTFNSTPLPNPRQLKIDDLGGFMDVILAQSEKSFNFQIRGIKPSAKKFTPDHPIKWEVSPTNRVMMQTKNGRRHIQCQAIETTMSQPGHIGLAYYRKILDLRQACKMELLKYHSVKIDSTSRNYYDGALSCIHPNSRNDLRHLDITSIAFCSSLSSVVCSSPRLETITIKLIEDPLLAYYSHPWAAPTTEKFVITDEFFHEAILSSQLLHIRSISVTGLLSLNPVDEQKAWLSIEILEKFLPKLEYLELVNHSNDTGIVGVGRTEQICQLVESFNEYNSMGRFLRVNIS